MKSEDLTVVTVKNITGNEENYICRKPNSKKSDFYLQEEYVAEKIEWTPIEYFNNKVVCELIESKKPPGIFCVLDDVCATLHAVSDGADYDLQKKLNNASVQHDHYEKCKDGFIVRHYAGKVSYNVLGFCDKNRDVLFPDLVHLMKSSTSSFVQKLFPEEVSSQGKSRPTTAGSKIRSQANALVEKLTKCRPHYIRCIKPNETKKPKEWNEESVKHQVEYLGLKENVRVRRAGFAYRRPFEKFLFRYGILTKETKDGWRKDEKSGVEWVMKKLNIPPGQYQLGLTKVFIKAPETLFMLEEQRERKYNYYARVIQKAFKKYFSQKQYEKEKVEAAKLVHGKKQRRQNSINRNFVGDYIGLDCKPSLQTVVGRREKIYFAEVVKKYDRNFKPSYRDLILTGSVVFLIGREKVKKGANKGLYQEVIKRRIEFEMISDVALSTLRDDFVVIHVRDNFDSCLEVMFKTEFLSCLSKNYYSKLGRSLNLSFSNKLEFKIKKEGWGGGGLRYVQFIQDDISQTPGESLKASGKVLTVTVPKGLPNTTMPSSKERSSHVKKITGAKQMPKGAIKIMNSGPPHIGYCRTAPPPPNEPAPPNQPVISSFRFNHLKTVQGQPVTTAQMDPNRLLGKIAEAGIAGAKRTSLKPTQAKSGPENGKPIPGNGKPRPPVKPKPVLLPRCKALYDYSAQDLDELSFNAGDVIDIVKEHEGGWWQGRIKGIEGLFPSNYIEKL